MRQFDGVKGGRYFLVQTLPQFEQMLAAALKQPALCVDTETTGLNWVHSAVCGIVIGWGIHDNYYLPIAHKTTDKQLGIFDILKGLQQLLGDPHKTYIFANAKFDLHGLRKLGIEIFGIIHDIVIMAHLLDENAEHGVKPMAEVYISPEAGKWETALHLWRGEEAKRRRHEFSTKAKARAADMMVDPIYIQRASQIANCAMTGMDPKVLKRVCKDMAQEELKGHLCAINKKEDITYDYVPLDVITPYACADVHYTLLLYKRLIIAIAQSNDLKKLYVNEMQLSRVLFNAEHGGVKIDVGYLRQIQPQFEQQVKEAAQDVYDAVGYEFNIGSAEQLTDALVKAGVTLTKLTKGSKKALREGKASEAKFSVDKEVMEFLAAKYAFADKILEYRNIEKLKGTYVDGILGLVDENDYLHTETNQNVRTGRMSMREPNLQNIPARNKAIRKAFIVPPNEDFVFVFIDYSQVELRLTADRSQDPTLLSCYPFEGEGRDVHTLTMADIVLGKPLAEVQAMKDNKDGHVKEPKRGERCECIACDYDFYRNIAKRVNFGIIYGAGPETIMQQVSKPTRPVSKEQCADYIAKYFEKYPGVKEWIKMTEYFMKKNGYVQNTFGRYRRLPVNRLMKKWQIERACRQGVNFLIQGEAADIFKIAAVRVDKIFKREKAKSRLINFVHDELQFYWHKKELALLGEVVRAMEDFHYTVPLKAEVSYSTTDWGTKKELKAA